MPGGSSSMLMLLIIIVPIGAVIYFVMKKKKSPALKTERTENEDEVWKTIKKYLKDSGEKGKEIIDSYVVKRPDPYNKSQMSKAKKKETKIAEKEKTKLKKSDPESYKVYKTELKADKKKKFPEQYVVLFTTRDTKTRVHDVPRAIECEVIYKKISKKDTQRKIVINGICDFENEMSWIKPIKAKDDEALEKQQKSDMKRENRIDKRNSRKVERLKVKPNSTGVIGFKDDTIDRLKEMKDSVKSVNMKEKFKIKKNKNKEDAFNEKDASKDESAEEKVSSDTSE